MSSNEQGKWYVYGYDRLGDFILILQHPKDQVYKATSTDDVERATKFYDIRSAETCIKWINNGTIKFYDDTVNTEDLKVAYIDEYGNLYDSKTDICVFFNSKGYETEEDELEEALKLLEDEGYTILDEDFTQGVGSMGADQGIPHSQQCCAVPMMRLGEPAPSGRIQKPCPGSMPPPPFRRPPIGLIPLGFALTQNASTGKRKKKKKKKKKKSSKKR